MALTTAVPVLPSTHPVRRCFARYGRYASRLAVSTLIISTAVATILIYPIPFLYTNDFMNGASNLPHHVWTLARPLPYDYAAVPDVIMRSIWIHASYMQALDAELLVSALDLQDELLGGTEDFWPVGAPTDVEAPRDDTVRLSLFERDALHAMNGLTNQSWLFQSPLLYWNCSKSRILADDDIVGTVNQKKNQSIPANLTLRHSIVFSGKRFEDRRLLAADALVITLLHLSDSPVGRLWESIAPSLPAKVGHQWDIYPPDGRVSASQLYEFQFRPISSKDFIGLAIAYGGALLYFIINLSSIQAIKSKIGLMATVLVQTFFSLMSSFTICAIFKVDLSGILRWMYPIVIFTTSLEDVFRLINAVIATPFEDSASNRIGYAFGETAHIALGTTLQKVLIAVAMSRFNNVHAGFCIFTAVAMVLNFFFFSTFFLSVLGVDVRRLELGDALAKESSRHNRRVKQGRPGPGPSWLKKLAFGNVAFSTRLAGTLVMIGFVLIVQWHFFDGEGLPQRLLRPFKEQTRDIAAQRQSLLEDVHQARSPSSWLRLQDHDTAREVIRILKPNAYSYIARVYDPLVFVKKGSDRMPNQREPSLLPAAYDFIHHQLATCIIIVILVIAVLRLLTSYLLLEDETAVGGGGGGGDLTESPNFSIKSLSGGHSLDIALLAESSGRHAVSVGLDRVIRVWNLRDTTQSDSIVRADDRGGELFPVLAVALDEESKWLAILSQSRVAFWNLDARLWGRSVAVNTFNKRPEACFFDNGVLPASKRLLIVWRSGTLTEIHVTSGEESSDFEIHPRIICARPLFTKGAESGDCIMHHFSPQNDDDTICLRNYTEQPIGGWCTWEGAKEVQKHVADPGAWGLASDGTAVGVRRRVKADSAPPKYAVLKQRKRFPGRDGKGDILRHWEVWRAAFGDRSNPFETLPLLKEEDEASHLVISELGPKVNVGQKSMAFAFGNVIKLVTVGGSVRDEPGVERESRELFINVSGRRRKLGNLARSTASF
ncbi:Sterol regulatory element-binding protein cleavage-activating protein [Escovopsis weberi]|uniref:Sterol regulatory element-binding protein cleavage-activating protein n=1 Tax=Escovopsis weberi TaxID=150374 RepID=A0A0M8N1N6_ESCWE|nr:Sterol regulatory element-binding protein cleavage-activating protein [Escovopsis weberi]